MLVQTIKGLVEREELEIRDIVEWGDNHRSIATEWRHRGELVKRDVHVILLRGASAGAAQGGIGG